MDNVRVQSPSIADEHQVSIVLPVEVCVQYMGQSNCLVYLVCLSLG